MLWALDDNHTAARAKVVARRRNPLTLAGSQPWALYSKECLMAQPNFTPQRNFVA